MWSDDFNRVTLESDCATYNEPGVVTLRYTVTETQPHGGVFNPCLDLYVYQGNTRVRTIREEGCGAPFLPAAAPGLDAAILKYQLLAFWDLKDDNGNAVAADTYTIYGRFYLYYDPVVSLGVTILSPNGTPLPTRTATPTIGPGGASIVLGTASGNPGERATFPATLQSAGAAVAGAQNDIAFDSVNVPIAATADGKPDCAVNPSIGKEGTVFGFLPVECSRTTCTAVRAVVVSFANNDPIADGSVLYKCNVSIAAQAAPGRISTAHQ